MSNNINKHLQSKHNRHQGLQSRPILLTCSLNVFGGNPLVSGFATMSSVLYVQ